MVDVIDAFGDPYVIAHFTDARLDARRVAVGFLSDAPVEPLDGGGELFPLLHLRDDDQMVFDAAHQQGVGEGFLEQRRDQPQQIVALFDSVLIVVGLHGVHVK